MKLTQIMASSCRQKIIEKLAELKQTHIMDLVRKVNSTYGQVDRNVQVLVKEGIVESYKYDRLRLIKLNFDHPKTKAILKALKILRQQERRTAIN